jgi:rubrerythrin
LSPEAAEADTKRRAAYLDELDRIDSHRRRQRYPEWYCDACGHAHAKSPKTPTPCEDCSAWLENPAELPERFAQ